ncbi:MAG: HD domain-containing protein [Clostridia bacterium]|nr:HD domain-containing protein [Clostridia bacterium]
MANMRIHKAIEFATLKHQGQTRKGTDIPYIVHPIEVMQILTANGCEEDIIIAGILHDTLEDTDTEREEIVEAFGARVAELVSHESEDKSKSWEERKQATVDRLRVCPDSVAICALADKLSNLRSIYYDYQRVGEGVWSRFMRGKEKVRWYYASVAEATKRLQDKPIWQEYFALLQETFGEELKD